MFPPNNGISPILWGNIQLTVKNGGVWGGVAKGRRKSKKGEEGGRREGRRQNDRLVTPSQSILTIQRPSF